MKKIIRATTVSQSLSFFEGTLPALINEYDVQLLSSPGERLDEMGVKYGITTHSVAMARRISPIGDIKSLFYIIKVFHKEKPYMVHSLTPKAGLLCMMASWFCQVPVRVHTFTGLVWPTAKGFKRLVLKFTDKLICECATHIIPEGEGVKNDLHAITNKPMHVLGYGNIQGVDMELWDPNRFAKTNHDYFQYLFTGRIAGDKGINELVWAFIRLQKIHPNIRLMLTGIYEKTIDPLLSETEKQIEENNAIEVNGPFFGDNLVDLYARADCFVMPSYREGFPNSVLEAGAMELPQIVTDINGSREIIKHGENGLIVPAKNKEALYDAMRLLYEDENLRNKLSSKAREMISSRFERSFVQKCQLDFYKEILEKSNV